MTATIRATLSAALTVCEHMERAQPNEWEFWRRLAGTIRKGLSKL